MKAIWNNTTIAEADKNDLVYIEQRWYFPPDKVRQDLLQPSPTLYTCPWKGVCQYFNVTDGKQTSADAAWAYPDPLPTSLDVVKKDYTNYVAFWRDVEVTE